MYPNTSRVELCVLELVRATSSPATQRCPEVLEGARRSSRTVPGRNAGTRVLRARYDPALVTRTSFGATRDGGGGGEGVAGIWWIDL